MAFFWAASIFVTVPGYAPISDSLFIKSYHQTLDLRSKKLHKKIRKNSVPAINRQDSILMIPTLAFIKEVDWDRDAPEKNHKYADWCYLDLNHFIVDDIIVYDCPNMTYYQNSGRYRISTGPKDEYMPIPGKDDVIKIAQELNPDGIFIVADIPGCFYICGNSIIAFSISNGGLKREDNAIDYLKENYTKKGFMAFHGKQLATNKNNLYKILYWKIWYPVENLFFRDKRNLD